MTEATEQYTYMDATFSFYAAVAAYAVYFEDEMGEFGFDWAMSQLEARIARGKTWHSDDEYDATQLRTAVIKEAMKVEG